MPKITTLTVGKAPHLKNEVSFIPMLSRELGAMFILLTASVWIGGLAEALLFLTLLAVTGITDGILRLLGFSSSPKWDLALVQQAVLLSLFVSPETPLMLAAMSAFVLTLFYRVPGGRGAYVMHPACLGLAFLSGLGYSPVYLLEILEPISAAVLFGVWAAVRFPRTRIETERFICVFFLAVILAALHGTAFGSALLWSAAAGEIIFGAALAPQVAKARLWYRGLMLAVFAMLCASAMWEKALLITGLTAGFFAAWLEKRALTQRSHVAA